MTLQRLLQRAAGLRREDGVSAVELGLLLPVLLMLLTVAMPLIKGGWEYMVVSRAAAHGIRYATRADPNSHLTSGGMLTRRPTTAEVDAFVRDAADPIGLTSVTVTPQPAGSLPGELITLQASYEVTFGPLATLANEVKSLFFGGGAFLPESKEITVSTRGREE
jgi:Flp pilus assembly protein TadG